MKVIFLDNDGVICLSSNWGSRHKKQKKIGIGVITNALTIPVECRFDNFDKKSVKVLNEILVETDAEIVVSSDWRLYATLEELGEYYYSQGIFKKPIGFTKKLGQFDTPNNFVWSRDWDLEQVRSLEIKQWLIDHPEVTHWVAVDDLDMSKNQYNYSMEWGLDNFVHTPRSYEGIKQSGIKDKILKFLS